MTSVRQWMDGVRQKATSTTRSNTDDRPLFVWIFLEAHWTPIFYSGWNDCVHCVRNRSGLYKYDYKLNAFRATSCYDIILCIGVDDARAVFQLFFQYISRAAINHGYTILRCAHRTCALRAQVPGMQRRRDAFTSKTMRARSKT
jgi:hypothetical protein